VALAVQFAAHRQTDANRYVFALTRDGFDCRPLPVGAQALSEKVAALRRGPDVGKPSDASGKSGLFDLALALNFMQHRWASRDAREGRSFLVAELCGAPLR
jgi:hypothetical protein